MTRSLTLALIPATLVGILLGCGRQEAPPAPPPVQEANAKPEPTEEGLKALGDADKKETKGEEAQAPNAAAEPSKRDGADKDSPGKSKPAPQDTAIAGLPAPGFPGTSAGPPMGQAPGLGGGSLQPGGLPMGAFPVPGQ